MVKLFKIEALIDGKKETRLYDKQKSSRNFYVKQVRRAEDEGGQVTMSIKEDGSDQWSIINQVDIPTDD